MKAKLENGIIRTYASLPSAYKSDTLNVLNGFDQLPAEVHQSEGFYDVIVPAIEEQTQKYGQITWSDEDECYIIPVIDLTAAEIQLRGWDYLDFAKRIIAPSTLFETYPSIATWMQINQLPIVMSDAGETCYLYMNRILPQHQALVDSLSDELTVEERPV